MAEVEEAVQVTDGLPGEEDLLPVGDGLVGHRPCGLGAEACGVRWNEGPALGEGVRRPESRCFEELKRVASRVELYACREHFLLHTPDQPNSLI